MKLHVIASGSNGNCYLLKNDESVLIIECGVPFAAIKEALNYDLSKVVGCLVTHEHKDHCKSAKELLASGVAIFASRGTHKAIETNLHHNAVVLSSTAVFAVGEFRVMPFIVQHDAAEPVGFLIKHEECGTVLFATDTYYLKYTFPALNNVIIEANYCENILDQRRENGTGNAYVMDRVVASHMSLQQCLRTLEANDLSAVNNVVLIHLSNANSDAKRFKHEVRAATQKYVSIAEPGLILNFNKTPF